MGPGEHRQRLLGVEVCSSELNIYSQSCGLERVNLVGHLRDLVNLVDLWPTIWQYNEGQRFQTQDMLVVIARQDLLPGGQVSQFDLHSESTHHPLGP